MIENRINELLKQRENRLEGKFNCLPFNYHFPRTSEYIPGLFKGSINTILSATGIGKSKFARYLSVIAPFELYKRFGIQFKTIFFSLEESKEEFIDNMIIMLLKIKHDISIDRLKLNSYYEKTFDKITVDAIKDIQKDIEELMQFVDVVDYLDKPTDIFMYCHEKSKEWGKHYYKEKNYGEETHEVYSHYEPHNKEEYVIVCLDHISLLSAEKGATKLHDAMSKWSSKYCVKHLAKHYNWCIINVQQTAMASDDLNHFKAGKLEPAISDAADCKVILRDAKLIFTLFAPDRYGLRSHNRYNIEKLKDSYRNLGIIKNRYGRSNLNVGLYFDGATGRFEELPQIGTKELNEFYQQI